MITNYLSPLEFRVAIARLPNIEFFVQRVNIPSINSTPVDQPTPFNRRFEQPDKLTYNNLDLQFIIDEDMKNYREIFDWMVAITAPQNFAQFKNINESDEGLISDITIQILNSHKNLNLEAKFINCFPISLSDIMLDTTNSTVQYPEASVSFQYDSFSIHKL